MRRLGSNSGAEATKEIMELSALMFVWRRRMWDVESRSGLGQPRGRRRSPQAKATSRVSDQPVELSVRFALICAMSLKTELHVCIDLGSHLACRRVSCAESRNTAKGY